MDHLEHLAECEVCENADVQVEATLFLDFETNMLEQRPEDVGIFDPTLVRLWDQEHDVQKITNLVREENKKYFGQNNLDLPLPPRSDEE